MSYLSKIKNHHFHWGAFVAIALFATVFLNIEINKVYASQYYTGYTQADYTWCGTQVKNIYGDYLYTLNCVNLTPTTPTYVSANNCTSFTGAKSGFQCFRLQPNVHEAAPMRLLGTNLSYDGYHLYAAPRPVNGVIPDVVKNQFPAPYSTQYARGFVEYRTDYSGFAPVDAEVLPGNIHNALPLCTGTPETNGWGCYYWVQMNFNRGAWQYVYKNPLAAFPPSAVNRLSVSCPTHIAERNNDGGKYTNVKFGAAVSNAGTNTTYTWTVNGQVVYTGPLHVIRAYVNPNNVANASVSVTSVVGGVTQSANSPCDAVTPQPNAVGLTCTGEKVDTTILGQPKNVKWTADVKWGKPETYSWTGNIVGSTNPIYGYIIPGQTGSERVTVQSRFPDGSIVTSSEATCNEVKMDPITTKCTRSKDDFGTPGTPDFKNMYFKASAYIGAINVTANAKFKWEVATSTGATPELAVGEDAIYRAYVAPGQSGSANVTASVNSVDGNKVSCGDPLPIAPVKTTCKAVPIEAEAPGAPNVALTAYAKSGTTDYSNLATFDWSLQPSPSSPVIPLDSKESTTNYYIKPGETAKVFVTSTLNGVTTSVCSDEVLVPKLEAKCTARKLTAAQKRAHPDSNIAFTATAIGTTNYTNTAEYDWTLSSIIDGVRTEVPVEGNNTKTIYAYALAGKTLTAKVNATAGGSVSENDDNTCSMVSPDPVSVSCSAISPFPGYILWQGKFSFEVDGVEYNERNYQNFNYPILNYVKWRTDKDDPFSGYDPLIPSLSGILPSLGNSTKDSLRILNYYNLEKLPAGQSLQKNEMTISLTLPPSTDPSVQKTNFLASIYNAIFAQRAPVGKKLPPQKVSCVDTFVPISGGTLAENIVAAATHTATAHERNEEPLICGDLGCALALNTIVWMATGADNGGKAISTTLAEGASNAQVFKDLRASKNFSEFLTIKPITIKDVKKKVEQMKLDRARMSRVLPGDVIITPSQLNARGEIIKHGHVGIIETVQDVPETADTTDRRVVIVSNSSGAGYVKRNYTLSLWYRDFVEEGGRNIHIFRPK